MNRYKITLSYDGTTFCGWQTQPGGGSIQQYLQEAIFKLSGEHTKIDGSGRTDKGVHALNQVANFDLKKEYDNRTIVKALNYYLPDQIVVKDATLVPNTFHSWKSVKIKTYMYLMYKSKDINPLFVNRAFKISPDCDIYKMQVAAREFIGTHDFTAVKSSGGSAKTSVRTVYNADIEQGDFGTVKFMISANGFLYNMVRIIVAQIIKAGEGNLTMSVPDIIHSQNRLNAKEIAPPYGLYLYKVDY